MTKLNARRMSRIAIGIMCLGLLASSAQSQGLGGAGTVQGTVKDPTGGVMQAVQVKISNPVTGFARIATTDAAGKYVFNNLPPSSSRGCGSGRLASSHTVGASVTIEDEGLH